MQLPESTDVPALNASVKEILNFCSIYDPTQDFIRRWGPSYREKVQDLWSCHIDLHREGGVSNAKLDELLMVLSYDFAIAPYIPESDQRRKIFLAWMLNHVRERVFQECDDCRDD